MAGKSKIDEDCEGLSVIADPWNLKLKAAKLKDVLFPLPVIVPYVSTSMPGLSRRK
jgi:hypothetical protein